MVKVAVTRDSVCAADDALNPPHRKIFKFGGGDTILCALKVLQSRYLPGISGGRATWIAKRTRPFAVLAQQWDEPKLLIDQGTFMKDFFGQQAPAEIHFIYCAQEDPLAVVVQLTQSPNGMMRQGPN